MSMKKSLKPKSRFLSLVLRHNPGLIGLTLDQGGWADVDQLLLKSAQHGSGVTSEELIEIVETNEKKRFDLDFVNGRIRANQGHSISVELELSPSLPPEFLFHGTAIRNRDSILSHGLIRGVRQHVHLSSDIATARAVGTRHGSPFIFRVASGKMHREGHVFFQSKNGVWLAMEVPPQYLGDIEERQVER